MGFGLKAAIAVAGAAVGVAVLRPELFLKIPKVGFIPWAMTGNPIPGYFSTEIWTQADDSWLKDYDVVVAAGAKSGTNWLMYTVHLLRTWDKPELQAFEQITDVVPWAEFVQTYRETPAERIKRWDSVNDGQSWNNKAYPFRVFKSHYYPKPSDKSPPISDAQKLYAILPIRQRPKVKFIAQVRHPEDVASSLFPFFANHDENFRAYWGGFPPAFSEFKEVIDFLVPTETIATSEYVKQWWPFKDDTNVLLLHYADFLGDKHMEVLKQIADFIGVKLSAQDLERVSKMISISEMKKLNENFRYRWGEKMDGLIMGDKGLIRKGGKGKFAERVSPEDKKRWDDHFAQAFKDSPKEMVEWYFRR